MKKIVIIAISIILLLVGCNMKADYNEAKNVTGKDYEQAQTEGNKGYLFNYKNTIIGIGMQMDSIVSVIGQPCRYSEEYSDELQGNYKTYDYNSFEINALEINNQEQIISICFKDDLIYTVEGVCLYMKKNDVINIYGDDYRDEIDVYVYEKDGMKLRFKFEDEDITNIEYFSSIVY